MPVPNRIAEFHADMTEWRRDFHAHPELALQEFRTSAIVAEKLKSFGVDDIITGLAGTGIVGVIRGNGPASHHGGPAIGLRADMDALPITERTGVAYASKTPGLMHACGHDGHTAMLLGAARYLAETRNFDGTVYVIFQPAEEDQGGARLMVEQGLFTACPMDQVFGLHNWPASPVGEFGWRSGPIMAAVADIDITITGKGCHGAHPDDGIDPIVVAAQIISALQTVVARNIDPTDGGVVTIGAIHAGQANNVIPETVEMKGTARWFDPAVGDVLERRVRDLVTGISTSFGATAEITYERCYPATINDAEATMMTVAAARAVAGDARVEELSKPSMGAEDFAFMLLEKQGSYIRLGAGRSPDEPRLHHPRYDFNDDILPIGVAYWVALAEQRLPRRS